MYQDERLEEILKIVSKKKVISNEDLLNQVYSSKSTLRRDLIILEKQGKIERKFGYITVVDASNVEFGYQIIMKKAHEKKKSIASIANNFIGDGEAIFCDSSTTCMHLVPYLIKKQNLIIITNGLHIATSLSERSDAKIYICGGHIYNSSGSVLGSSASEFISNFRADIAFISCEGISKNGIYMSNDEQAQIKEKIITQARETILLCDSSKVNKESYYKLCGYDNIDTIITDKKPEKNSFLVNTDIELLYPVE